MSPSNAMSPSEAVPHAEAMSSQSLSGLPRLHKVLAQAGVASRRAAEEMIARGRVQVDGVVVREMGVRVDPERAVIHVDGLRLALHDVRRPRPPVCW
jgi:23S rRNA pseudouridine2605 synthase